MLYTPEVDPNVDPACNNGQGLEEVATNQCRSNPTISPTAFYLIQSPEESSCIFPFKLDDQEYNRCVLQGIDGFTQPLFKCPVRKIRGRDTSYLTETTYREYDMQPPQDRKTGSEIVNVGYCPTNCASATGYWNAESNDGVTYTFDPPGAVKIGPGKYDYELDPTNYGCAAYQRLPVFAVCKNNCPGGNFFVFLSYI